MKTIRKIHRMTAAGLGALLLLAACDHKELCYQHPHTSSLHVVFDWREAPDADPESMYVWFFPEEGGEPVQYHLAGKAGGAVSLAEGICLTETGSRMYDGNLWWGAFICYDILLLESLIQLLRRLHKKPRTPVETGTSVLCCGALAWHIASGIVFLGLMLAGISYAVMIGTESYLLQEMWGIVL